MARTHINLFANQRFRITRFNLRVDSYSEFIAGNHRDQKFRTYLFELKLCETSTNDKVILENLSSVH